MKKLTVLCLLILSGLLGNAQSGHETHLNFMKGFVGYAGAGIDDVMKKKGYTGFSEENFTPGNGKLVFNYYEKDDRTIYLLLYAGKVIGSSIDIGRVSSESLVSYMEGEGYTKMKNIEKEGLPGFEETEIWKSNDGKWKIHLTEGSIAITAGLPPKSTFE